MAKGFDTSLDVTVKDFGKVVLDAETSYSFKIARYNDGDAKIGINKEIETVSRGTQFASMGRVPVILVGEFIKKLTEMEKFLKTAEKSIKVPKEKKEKK